MNGLSYHSVRGVLFLGLYKYFYVMDGTIVETMEKPGSTLAMKEEDFLIEMVVTWSTTVEKKTSANWTLSSNIPINKARTHTCTHIRTHAYMKHRFTFTQARTHTRIHTRAYILLHCIHSKEVVQAKVLMSHLVCSPRTSDGCVCLDGIESLATVYALGELREQMYLLLMVSKPCCRCCNEATIWG